MPQKKIARTKLKPRKAPSQSRSVETVQALLEAAAHVLEKHGLEGYSTNIIAERAGVSIGSLYQYFPNKDALTMALLERESRSLLDAISAVDTSKGLESALELIMSAAVQHQLGRPTLARLLDVEEMRFPPSAELMVMKQKIIDIVVQLFRTYDHHFVESDEQVAEDLLSITRSITDSAGERKESDRVLLLMRLMRAATGFLQMSRKSTTGSC